MNRQGSLSDGSITPTAFVNLGPVAGGVPIGGIVVTGSQSESSVVPSSSPIQSAVVWLEQPSRQVSEQGSSSTLNVDNLRSVAMTISNGAFRFCVPPGGSYDVVVQASGAGSNSQSSVTVATITSSVTPGIDNLTIPIVQAAAATITGEIVTQKDNSNAGADDQIPIVALQIPCGGSGNLEGDFSHCLTSAPMIPLSAATTFTNGNGGSPTCSSACPANSNCGCYTTQLPLSNPAWGQPSADGTGYQIQPAPQDNSGSPQVPYWIDAAALSNSSRTPVCTPSELAASFTATSSSSAPTISFNSCD